MFAGGRSWRETRGRRGGLRRQQGGPWRRLGAARLEVQRAGAGLVAGSPGHLADASVLRPSVHAGDRIRLQVTVEHVQGSETARARETDGDRFSDSATGHTPGGRQITVDHIACVVRDRGARVIGARNRSAEAAATAPRRLHPAAVSRSAATVWRGVVLVPGTGTLPPPGVPATASRLRRRSPTVTLPTTSAATMSPTTTGTALRLLGGGGPGGIVLPSVGDEKAP